MQPILEIKNLHKSFGNVRAVQGTSFEVHPGECFGLLGPNGAGKSTTIEMIENIIYPNSGEILFQGKKIGNQYLENLGVQFQETSLPAKLTVLETLQTFRNLYQNPKPLKELIETCQLEDFQNQFHDKISGGQRQRLLLAIALCHNPKLVLLDEPTTGLDPQARRHLWKIVKDIKADGKTIILTTHYMDEAFELCDRIGIMDHGKIIAMGSPQSLLEEHFRTTIVGLPVLSDSLLSQEHKEQLGVVKESHRSLEIHTENLNETLKQLVQLNYDLSNIEIRQSDLEDLFIKLTGKSIRS